MNERFGLLRRWRGGAVGVILLLALGYNFLLALVNAHLHAVSAAHVMAFEGVLLAFALLLVAANWRAELTRWALMAAAVLALFLLLSLFRSMIAPKMLRDMMLVAIFIALGIVTPRDSARRTLLLIHCIIVAVALIELLWPEHYGAAVGTQSYLINTRGFDPDRFFDDSQLFNAVRPGDRFFLPALGWIRASSIFLEPLSLGNYCAVAVLFIYFFWRDYRPATRIFLVASWAFLLVASDGRFAGMISLLLLLGLPLFARLPAALAVLYLPMAVAAAEVFVWLSDTRPVEDTFGGRIARGMKRLNELTGWDLAGFSVPTPVLADSGIAYLVMAQSLAGVLLFQLFVYFNPMLKEARQRAMLHGVAFMYASSMLVSYSMLSIKTAALLWFAAGLVIARVERGVNS
jgi:putative polymerase